MTLFDIPHRAIGTVEILKITVERDSLNVMEKIFAWVAGLSNAFLGYVYFCINT